MELWQNGKKKSSVLSKNLTNGIKKQKFWNRALSNQLTIWDRTKASDVVEFIVGLFASYLQIPG